MKMRKSLLLIDFCKAFPTRIPVITFLQNTRLRRIQHSSILRDALKKSRIFILEDLRLIKRFINVFGR